MPSIVVRYQKATLDVDLPLDATVSVLKDALMALTGVDPRKQKLLFKGKILEVQDRLEAVGLKAGARIMLLVTEAAQTEVTTQKLLNRGQTSVTITAQERLAKAKEKAHARLYPQPASKPRTPQLEVENWKKMRVIACRDRGLDVFPWHALDVGSMAESMDISHNRLREIPFEIHHLQELRLLDLSINLLTVDGLGKGIYELMKLKRLRLDGNVIEALPSEIGRLTCLEWLSVVGTGLGSLPDCFHQLPYLTDVNFSNNDLGTLPPSLGECQELKILNVSSNRLRELPTSISLLINLRIIRADDNRLRVIQASLLKGCRSLVMLSLHRNPITIQELREIDGFEAYELRRKEQYDKKLDTGAMQPGERFDQGGDQSHH